MAGTVAIAMLFTDSCRRFPDTRINRHTDALPFLFSFCRHRERLSEFPLSPLYGNKVNVFASTVHALGVFPV